MKLGRRGAIALGGLLVLALATIALVLSIGGGVTKASDVVIDTRTYEGPMQACIAKSGKEERLTCVQGLIVAAANVADFGGAIGLARRAVDEDPLLFTGPCHNQAHLLGKAIVANGMDYQEAYKVPFPDCRYGFYHGALEAHVAPMSFDEVRANLTQLCAYFGSQDTDPVRECVHVTGHFLVDRADGKLASSIDACGEFGDGQLYNRCLDGVFMQTAFLMTPSPSVDEQTAAAYRDKITREQGDEGFSGTCASLPDGDPQETCFTKAALFWSLTWGEDYPRIGNQCTQLDNPRWRKGCFEGVAAVPLNEGIWDAAYITDVCTQLGNEEGIGACIRSMAISFGVQLSPDQVTQVCDAAPEAHLATCQNALEEGKAIRQQLGQAAGSVTTTS